MKTQRSVLSDSISNIFCKVDMNILKRFTHKGHVQFQQFKFSDWINKIKGFCILKLQFVLNDFSFSEHQLITIYNLMFNRKRGKKIKSKNLIFQNA